MNKEIFKNYKQIDEKGLDTLLLEEIHNSNLKIVVLDDDPTGTQTVHDISVYADWSYQSIREGFLEENNLFYILTNSRSFSAEQTQKAHREIAQIIASVAKELDKDYVIISRSDSTLRGHYPLETAVLKECYESDNDKKIDGEILCPFFKEGGRFTLNNIHYVAYGEELIPAAETEFAKDSTFGYTKSDLREYIEEKTEGAYHAEDVICISIEMLRAQNYAEIEALLMNAEHFNKIIVNAIDYCDLKVFCIALYRVFARGKHFLFRSAASLVKVLSGVPDIPLLERKDMVTHGTENGGIVVIGSYTKKTTAQFENLKDLKGLTFLEFNSDLVLEEEKLTDEVTRVIHAAEEAISGGRSAIIYTKRKLLVLDTDTKEEILRRSTRISEALQSIVAGLTIEPSFIIAKGGITSSDILTKALRVKHGWVLGQAAPGIPVVQTDEGSKFPNIPYIIFPGNVGEDTTLRQILNIFIPNCA